MKTEMRKPGDCVRRALVAALKYAGVKGDTDWIPPSIRFGSEVKELIAQLLARYPWLTCYGLDADDDNPEVATVENEPVVIFYRYHLEDTTAGHVIFLNDSHLLRYATDIRVSLTVTGWNRRLTWVDTETYQTQHDRHLKTLREIAGEDTEVLDLSHFTDGFFTKCNSEVGALRLAHFFRHAVDVTVKKVLERAPQQLFAVQVRTEGRIVNPFAAAEIIADARRLQRDCKDAEVEWAAAAIQNRAEELMSYILRMKDE